MKKIDNKGFTLIELLAVIVILIVIASIAIPSISSSIERTNDTQEKGKKELVATAVELYLSDHRSYRDSFYNSVETSKCYILVSDLIPKYLDESAISDSSISKDDVIYYYNNEIGIFGSNGSGYSRCS